MADNDTKTLAADPKPVDVDKARADAQAAQTKAIDAQAKADDAKKTDEQRAADKARADADMARSKAAQAEASLVPSDPMTVREAKVISPHATPDMSAGHHLAQQFSNQPANPAPALPEHEDPDLMTVKLTMTKSDGLGAPVITIVHPDMVGDYLRAGWAKA